MAIWETIANLFKPAADLVDSIHTSQEEKLQLKNRFEEIQNTVTMRWIEFEAKLIEAQTALIKADATGRSWLQRNWRPITMLTFLFLVVADSYGWLVNPLSDKAWELLKIGLGGYVVGRSVEKTLPSTLTQVTNVIKMLKSAKDKAA